MAYQNKETVYHGKRFDILTVDVPHREGHVIRRELVSHPGAVVILPLLDEETVILIRNERFSVSKTLIELPAGTLEKGEDPLRCAYRELKEETGYSADSMTPLTSFYASPGFCNEMLHAYLAKDLNLSFQELDATEKIEVIPTPLTVALQMIKEGKIMDAKTISTLLYFTSFIR